MSFRKAKPMLTIITEEDGHFLDDDTFIRNPSPKGRAVWSGRKTFFFTTLLSGIAALILSLESFLPSSESTIITRSATATTTASTLHLRTTLTESQQHCTVWIAPSSLKGVNGYGTFTTRDLAAGERVLPSHDGLGIPIESYRHRDGLYAKERLDWIRVWDNYWWGRGVPDHVAYEAPPDVVDFQIGFGALPNHHCLLEALDIQYPAIAYDDSMVDRYRDAGTGAFSYNMGREFLVTKPLRAGDELFLNYGYCKRDLKMPDWTKNIYMTEDFMAAASLVSNYKRQTGGPITYDSKGQLQIVDKSQVQPLVEQLLPRTKRELDDIVHGAVYNDQIVTEIARNSLNRRTPDWIRQNGMCMENIIPKISTLPQAGQGAFANFNIARNEIIAPAPLMQILDKSALYIITQDGSHNGTQLLMNYCFGHKDSTLLLCPNTNAVLINHCSTRSKGCGPDGPNARYQWSSGWDPASDEWRKMSLDQLREQNGRGLAFEIVAIRSIREGEEIFIDYGREWEEAWDDHVAHWQPLLRDPSFVSVKEANEKEGPIFDSLVSGNLRTAVDHPHLFTGCVYGPTQSDDREDYHVDIDWKELSDKEILKRYASDGSIFKYSRTRGPGDYRKHTDKVHWPCTVIWRDDDSDSYVVWIHQTPYIRKTGEMSWHRHKLPRILYNYPRESIRYFKQPFTSDQHLAGVFRQPIGIRDDMFPKHWKNLRLH